MNISSMKELDHLTVDMNTDTFGKKSTWPVFDVRGEIGNAPYCTCYCNTDECECRENTRKDNVSNSALREAEMIYAETVKKEKETMRAAMPSTVGVVQRKNTTVVNWDDGVKTVATLKEEDCLDMMFIGFCIAYTKKMLGSTTNILKTIEANDTDTINKRKKEFEEQIKKTMREANEQQEKTRFEAAVQAKMYEDRVIEEAIRRIRIRNERKTNNDET